MFAASCFRSTFPFAARAAAAASTRRSLLRVVSDRATGTSQHRKYCLFEVRQRCQECSVSSCSKIVARWKRDWEIFVKHKRQGEDLDFNRMKQEIDLAWDSKSNLPRSVWGVTSRFYLSVNLASEPSSTQWTMDPTNCLWFLWCFVVQSHQMSTSWLVRKSLQFSLQEEKVYDELHKTFSDGDAEDSLYEKPASTAGALSLVSFQRHKSFCLGMKRQRLFCMSQRR